MHTRMPRAHHRSGNERLRAAERVPRHRRRRALCIVRRHDATRGPRGRVGSDVSGLHRSQRLLRMRGRELLRDLGRLRRLSGSEDLLRVLSHLPTIERRGLRAALLRGSSRRLRAGSEALGVPPGVLRGRRRLQLGAACSVCRVRQSILCCAFRRAHYQSRRLYLHVPMHAVLRARRQAMHRRLPRSVSAGRAALRRMDLLRGVAMRPGVRVDQCDRTTRGSQIRRSRRAIRLIASPAS